ncbi:hypothetical protein OAG24_00890 [bacterium]|nr:hypothetical protein [bacterium]
MESNSPSFLPEHWGTSSQKALTTPSAQGKFLLSDWHHKDPNGNGTVRMVSKKDAKNYPSQGRAFYLKDNGSLFNWADPAGGCINLYKASEAGKGGDPYISECAAGSPFEWKGGTNYKGKPGDGSGLYFNSTDSGTKSRGNLCYNPNKGLYTFGEYGGKEYGEWNHKECSWIDSDTARWCCSTPNILSPDKKYCDPSYMPNTPGGTCPSLMLELCQNKWDSTACKNYLQAFKNSPDAHQVVKTAIVNELNRREPPDYTPARDNKDPFLTTTTPSLCSTVPGACDGLLNQYCAQFTRSDLNKDITLQRLCGCHMSKGEQPSFSELKLENPTVQPNQYIYPGVDIECDPTCRFSNTIPYSVKIGNTWVPAKCDATTCILSNISLNDINSTGGFNIDQNCGGCGDGNCSCYITDVIINKINSQGKVNLKQNCGSCYVTKQGESGANAKRVECATLGPYAGGGGFWEILEKYRVLIIVILILLVVVIAIAIAVVYYEKKKRA